MRLSYFCLVTPPIIKVHKLFDFRQAGKFALKACHMNEFKKRNQIESKSSIVSDCQQSFLKDEHKIIQKVIFLFNEIYF